MITETARIIENAGWLTFDRLLRMGVGLFVTVWIARYLGPQNYGLLNYAVSFAGLFSALAYLGLRGIVVQDMIHHPRRAQVTLGTAFALRLFAAVPIYAAILIAYAAMRPADPYGLSIVAIVAASVLIQAFEIIDHWFQAHVQSRYAVWARIAAFVVVSLLRVVLIGRHASLRAFAWVLLLEGVLVLWDPSISITARGTGWLSGATTGAAPKSCWPGAGRWFFEGMMIVIYMTIDQVMLGVMVNDTAVGIYNAATRVSGVWYFIPAAIVESVTPALLRSKQTSDSLYYSRLARLFSLLVLISVSVAAPLALCSTQIIRGLFGPSYAAAGPILAIHIWAAPFVFLGLAQSPWSINEGLTVLSFQRAAIGAASNVVLNLLLIPQFGGLGAAVATVVSYALAAFFSNAIDKRTRRIFFLQLRAFTLRDLFG